MSEGCKHAVDCEETTIIWTFNNELTKQNEELKEKEQQLTEKMEQNKTFIKLLHQSELEGKAEDVIHDIRMSSTGRKNMGSADWKQLYQAVDELYPTFKDRLLKELGTFTEQQMQVCYLMRIGLSKPQIQNMTNLARVTIWRWVKKYDWVFVSEEWWKWEIKLRKAAPRKYSNKFGISLGLQLWFAPKIGYTSEITK